MKRYSRKALIRFFSKLPPRSRPCKQGLCPIAVFMGRQFIKRFPSDYCASTRAVELDEQLADAVDLSVERYWDTITAARIVKIAKSLG
jgi:hypothetical protein